MACIINPNGQLQTRDWVVLVQRRQIQHGIRQSKIQNQESKIVMTRIRSQAISVAFLGILAGLPRVSGQVPQNPTVPQAVGINIHFRDPQPGELDMLARTGVGWVRVDYFWTYVEKKAGQYDFSLYDSLMDELDVFHIRPIFILDYTNPLYDQGLSPCTNAGRSAFAAWAAASAAHFRGRGILWEIYNEPNRSFWKPQVNVQDYVLLAVATTRAILKAAPGEAVIGPAVWGEDFDFVEACFHAHLLDVWAAVSIHPYRGQEDPETVTRTYGMLRRLMKRYKPVNREVPIISSEWGYSAGSEKGELDEALQAKLLARQWLVNLMESIPVSIWFSWRDSSSGSRFGLVNRPYHSGGDPVYQPKIAYRAASTLTAFFRGYRMSRRVSLAKDFDYMLEFRNGSNARFAMWSQDNFPHPVAVLFPAGKYSVTDFKGDSLPTIEATRGRATLTVTDGPIYLARLSAK
jgi:polysaccharide biosynthesis protein PslG